MTANAEAPFDVLRAAAADGDREALAELYRRHHGRLVAYLAAQLPARHGADLDADDLAADTWLLAAGALGKFRGDEDQFRGWLITIARRHLLNTRRKLRRRATDAHAPGELPQLAAPDDPAHAAADRDSCARLAALLARLPDTQAEVLRLRYLADLDVATVAKLVRRPPGTVRVLAHRGLARLNGLLVDPAVTPPRGHDLEEM